MFYALPFALLHAVCDMHDTFCHWHGSSTFAVAGEVSRKNLVVSFYLSYLKYALPPNTSLSPLSASLSLTIQSHSAHNSCSSLSHLYIAQQKSHIL